MADTRTPSCPPPFFSSDKEIWNAALRAAIKVLSDHQVRGREWVPGSFWDTLTNEMVARVHALKKTED